MTFDFNIYGKLMSEKKLDEALNYRKSHMPKKIYKYVALSDMYICNKDKQNCTINQDINELKFKALNNNQIWTSRVDDLNDPYEFKAMYLKVEELVNKGWPIDMLSEYLNRMKNSFLISSFTTNLVDNMPMWAHYSNNHKGYCIEYNVLNAKAVYPISYEEVRFAVGSIITDTFNLVNKIQNGDINEMDNDFQFHMELLTHFALMKHKSWEYENEYRILYADSGVSKVGTLIPMLQVGLDIAGIYCGSQCSLENKDRLSKIAGNIGTKAFEMYLDDNETNYKLSYRTI